MHCNTVTPERANGSEPKRTPTDYELRISDEYQRTPARTPTVGEYFLLLLITDLKFEDLKADEEVWEFGEASFLIVASLPVAISH